MKYLSDLLSVFLDNFYAFKKIYSLRLFNIVVLCFCVSPINYSIAAENDSDGDGLSDTFEVQIGTEAYLSDTDGDGIKDGVEVGKNHDNPLDSDSDSIIDALDYDDDNDNLPTFLESKIDSDKDGLLDYLDTDSDNDGISDGEEAGVLNQDKNFDGVDDAFDSSRLGAVDTNGDGIDDDVTLPDYNKDGKPDYLDANFQNKKITKVLVKKTVVKKQEVLKAVSSSSSITNDEAKTLMNVTKVIENIKDNDEDAETVNPITDKKEVKQLATVKEMVINRHTDSDNDGLSNDLEKRLGTNHLSRDSDGDNVSDAVEIGLDVNSPQDSDRDGLIDALDADDDNDGILTKLEDLNKDNTAINDDTDADGVPNYLDANDDGDDKLTIDEGYVLDSDSDGILNYLDKNDGLPIVLNNVTDKDRSTKSSNNEASSEPEIIVLFDGNAADLVAQENENIQSLSESQGLVSQTLAEVSLNDIDIASIDKETQAKQQSKTLEVSNKHKSHWNLF